MELTTLVERRARGRLYRRVQEPLTRLLRRLDSFRPRTMQLQYLGAPHETLPAIRNEIRLRLTPAGQCAGPLLRSTEVEDLETTLDDAAVHVADHERGYLAGVTMAIIASSSRRTPS